MDYEQDKKAKELRFYPILETTKWFCLFGVQHNKNVIFTFLEHYYRVKVTGLKSSNRLVYACCPRTHGSPRQKGLSEFWGQPGLNSGHYFRTKQ